MADGIMPAGGPETVLATEKAIGTNTSSVKLSTTFTNTFAVAANKAEGYTTTTKPEPDNG